MEDPAGNIVDQAQTFTTDEVNTATVKIDATPPKLKTGTVCFTTADTSNEDDPDLTSTNTLLAKNGEAIYFDFETEERIENPSVTINGSALSSPSDVSPLDSTGTKWRATYTPECDRRKSQRLYFRWTAWKILQATLWIRLRLSQPMK